MAVPAKRLLYGLYIVALALAALNARPATACTFINCETEKEDCGWCGVYIEQNEPFEEICCTNSCCTLCMTGRCYHLNWGETGCQQCDSNFVMQCVCACGPTPGGCGDEPQDCDAPQK